ncbi:hypothetical protein TWF730_004145 [Orbilia blumenaviensis]|uniref:Glycosylphosphatidylinositol anchor biosynthesis protein 11 n=1 Tax=Orbilia blumenaviensis TaxID=1796055 RepID=A0AAV9U3F1_9PEZI
MAELNERAVDGMIDPEIFKQVQSDIDEDIKVREEIRGLLKTLDRHDRSIQSVLSRVHAVPASSLASLLASAQPFFDQQRVTLKELDGVASKYPYYKYNGIWTREIQAAAYGIVLAGWLGAFTPEGEERKEGQLMTITEVGEKLGVRVNVKDTDVFHLTLEEYLHSLITMIEELARLAVNSVTLGDYQRPMLISRFVKDLHAGFQLLNLKNDSLRKRSDGIKYQVKKIEDVVYDLALRKLINQTDNQAPTSNPNPHLRANAVLPIAPLLILINLYGQLRSVTAPYDMANMVDRSAIAETVRHIHPIILLGALYATFTPLVNDPPTLLLQLLPVTIGIQIIHASTCLGSSRIATASGNNNNNNSSNKKKTKAASKGKSEDVGVSVLTAFLSLFLALLVGTPAIFVVIVLLGAPITADLSHTVLCAAHLSVLAGLPLVYSYHVQGSKWRDIVSLNLPMDEVYGGALGACLGAWLGAIPIPLDWDRDWQRWPVTIVVGIYAGYAVGRLGGLALVGKVARFN